MNKEEEPDSLVWRKNNRTQVMEWNRGNEHWNRMRQYI